MTAATLRGAVRADPEEEPRVSFGFARRIINITGANEPPGVNIARIRSRSESVSGRSQESLVGLGTYLRRKLIAPLQRAIDTQTAVLCDMQIAQLLASEPYTAPKRLERYGYRTYSQNDEDGILQEVLRRLEIERGSFVEFGVEDGTQNNTLLLLVRDWKGLWIEADERACSSIKTRFRERLNTGQLQITHDFVTSENINRLIRASGLQDADVLSIDIDGNDYWIWDAIDINAPCVIIEYNAKFRPPVKWVVPYDPRHVWDGTDNFGASLASLDELAARKGYTLVGCCLAGVNAFFVRNDLLKDRFAAGGSAQLYNPPRYYLDKFLPAGHPVRAGRSI